MLKDAEVATVHKKNKKTTKQIIDRWVSSLICLKLMYQQLNTIFDSIFSPIQCSFCKGHSVQHGLMNSGFYSLTFLKYMIR